ncbi:hypothetical protein RsS62_56790 [Rhizobium dioscoreae]|nr:hypothetical protein RsS62_56790 [Rhizobium dioscoreae]
MEVNRVTVATDAIAGLEDGHIVPLREEPSSRKSRNTAAYDRNAQAAAAFSIVVTHKTLVSRNKLLAFKTDTEGGGCWFRTKRDFFE